MFKILQKAKSVSALVLACAGVTLLTGCSAADRITDVNNTFLEDVDISKTRENLPFDHAWVNPNYTKSEFATVYFKPVRIDLLPDDAWIKSTSVLVTDKADYLAKAQEIADYFHTQLVDKTARTPKKRLTVTQSPGPDSIVIEIVLTELELSHPIARVGTMAPPIPGTGAALSTITDPHVAFAARLTDGATGKLIATVADRKFAPTRILDLNKFTVSSSAREICALWADTISEAVQGDGFTKISEKRFDWKLW